MKKENTCNNPKKYLGVGNDDGGEEFDILSIVRRRVSESSSGTAATMNSDIEKEVEKQRADFVKSLNSNDTSSSSSSTTATTATNITNKSNQSQEQKKQEPDLHATVESSVSAATVPSQSSFTNNIKEADYDTDSSGEFDILDVVRERKSNFMICTGSMIQKANGMPGQQSNKKLAISAGGTQRTVSSNSKESVLTNHQSFCAEKYAITDEELEGAPEALADIADMEAPEPPSLYSQQPVNLRATQPGAFSGAPGESLQRRDNICFSLVGVGFDQANLEEGAGLAEASPVEEHIVPDMEARPFDENESRKKKAMIERGYRAKLALMPNSLTALVVIVGVSFVVLLGAILGSSRRDNNNESIVLASNEIPTPSPTRPLPPMRNLELLYNELPEKTRESLHNRATPQYKAWEWLVNHPNMATYPEWRKKQVFAMATFFYSFEGPNWPEAAPARHTWMDWNTSECFWVFGGDAAYAFSLGTQVFGPTAYDLQDFQACNEYGELQNLFLLHVVLPTNMTVSIPPEVGLLTSLKFLIIAYNQLSAKLSDLLLPEVIQLPSLEMLSLHGNGFGGTVPSDLSRMTSLRHLFIGANALTGTFPSQLAKMTSLEHLFLDGMDGITGKLPSELGLMTRLTGLEIGLNSLSGKIPSELCRLRYMRRLAIDGNQFTGSLPEELWELSHLDGLGLSNLPNLHGSVPPETLMPNLTILSLNGSPHLSGTIPEQICFIQDLNFDCSDELCGCDCQCLGRSSNETNL